ncbi:cytochrome b/b6 domain-containing protein [Algirhabdus cladophorae]|uniref:cytochrome b/b6 domain-containing protein n=1 Tax=Algirhabdus cladophorae TaxID=3377108 RepID=UPI003B84946C
MPAQNSLKFYGSVTKSFHWLTAALIITLIPLGVIANGKAHQIKSGEMASDASFVEQTAFLFSLHKTLGVTVFFVAIARILWALSQTKPGLLNADKKLESWLAETVHYTLYASLIVVPLSGWVHHAASSGFAPIWWPFGQNLPLVPKSDTVSHIATSLHIIFERVLILSIFLHVAGALKHHFIDRDNTLMRMLPGTPAVPEPDPNHKKFVPILTAGVVYIAALGIGSGLGMFATKPMADTATGTQLETAASQWQVQDGNLGITVMQFGSAVEGQFADWTASISYDREAPLGPRGTVEIAINIGSLSLGSVTDQAMGFDFFDRENHPTAIFKGDLIAVEDNHMAVGTLTLKGINMPLSFPFDLSFREDIAQASGRFSLNRIDYGIGASMPDESSLAFGVDVRFELTAQQ